MPTTQDYINGLKRDKNLLKQNLSNLGMEVTDSDNFSTLATKTGSFVPSANLQEKDITITENGDTTILADDGYDGLSEVNITTNVSGGGGTAESPFVSTLSANPTTGGLFSFLIKKLTREMLSPLASVYNTRTSWQNLFDGCQNLEELDLTDFNSTNVTNFGYMFQNTPKLTSVDLSVLNTSNLQQLNQCFNGTGLERIDLRTWDTSKVTNIGQCFRSSGAEILLPNNAFPKVTSLTYLFASFKGDFSKVDLDKFSFNPTSSTLSGQYVFSNITSKPTTASSTLDLKRFNTSKFNNMTYMFDGTKAYTSLDISNWDVSNVTTMGYMFQNTAFTSSILFPDNFGSNCQYMYYMFYNCNTVTRLDLTKFNTSLVKGMNNMFQNTPKIAVLDLSSFDFTAVTSFTNMFAGCGTNSTVADGAYAAKIPYVIVADSTAQSWILTKSNGKPTTWTTSNVVIKGSANDPTR